MKRVLIVEDSVYVRLSIKSVIKKAGFETVGETSFGRDVLKMVAQLNPDIVILDNILPDINGFDVLQELSVSPYRPKTVVLSALDHYSTINKARKLGAAAYIKKPYEPQQLVEILNSVLIYPSPAKQYFPS